LMPGRQQVSTGTARRELETLSAAINFAYREKKLSCPVRVSLPPKAPPRQRWLTRSEVAALLLGALGFQAVTFDSESHLPTTWRRQSKPQYHLARFILLGLYTGTRHDAILKLTWVSSLRGGWCDVEHGILYRKADDELETTKRRPPIPIPDRLLPHLRRWKKLTAFGPCEYESQIIKKQKRAWRSARLRAGLDKCVTPHVLRHTCATWLLQEGISTWEVAGYLGTSEKVVRDVYGHHAPTHLENAKRAFSKRTDHRPGPTSGVPSLAAHRIG
jgi:integrase